MSQPLPRSLGKVFESESFRLVLPVVLAGFANAMLFFSLDRTQLSSLLSATLGMGLLGMVLVRQLSAILALKAQVASGLSQLSVVSEVVSTLNSCPNVGANLSLTLDRLVNTLEADAGAIWLPSADDETQMLLVEQRGLPEAHRDAELLASIQEQVNRYPQRVLEHSVVVPGRESARHRAHCVTARMGRVGEEFGYLTLIKWHEDFSPTSQAIISAVGSDIGGALRSIRMLSDMRKLADRDPVTGLHNHRSAYQRLRNLLEQAGKSERPLAVLMMDLDNFKLFNDTYGHPAGDEILKRVAGVLKRATRDHDVVARYGGDEFMVVLPDANLQQAMKVAERIQAALGKERVKYQDSQSLPIGFSYGISVFPEDSEDVLQLVSVADAHLYQSKTRGGNQITVRGQGAPDAVLPAVKGQDLFQAMVSAIDNKDGYTRQHSEEVTDYSLQIAQRMEVGEEMLRTIGLASMLHDVGKIGVPDAILRKPGNLTDEEFDIMRQHPVFGALIVGAVPGMEQVVLGVRHHHERYDGRGYPDRLKGEDIPLIGRIMAVADAYSAMTTSRPYRKGLTERQALDAIEKGLGTQFDPEIGKLWVELRQEAAARETREKKEAAAPRRRSRRPRPMTEDENAPKDGAVRISQSILAALESEPVDERAGAE